jgi:hypothetical protein
MSAANFRRSRSTRAIPDFVRLRFYLDDDFPCIKSQVDLIIELKKRGTNHAMIRRLLAKALRQVRNQAHHAFQQDDDLVVVGFIIAAGNVWQYGELERSDALVALPNPNFRDKTYTPTPSAISECSSSICSTPAAPSRRTTTSRVTSPNVLRSSNPSPPSQAQIRLDTMGFPRVFTNTSLPEQSQWLSDVKE